MKELVDHKAYEVLRITYSNCLLDYLILLCDREYPGESTHKEAVIEAIL